MCAAFSPSSGIQKEVIDANIKTDIGKKKCYTCILDNEGNVLERYVYRNTAKNAREFAKKIAAKYGAEQCQAACGTSGIMWIGTFEAEGRHIKLASTHHMAMMAKTGKKTDKVDAKTTDILGTGMIPGCYVPASHIRDTRKAVRKRVKRSRSSF